ncbi:ROST-like protein [Mya arenaria]|uniref:ROST-like protein n=1 Tax=Mya arenaria TaxID=6604 RepID=A0ABY7FXG8_MYAAR|nr:protein rolling stone-like [Mya arenaria]WAR25839.1 ROST-like protein [Mya arenaria]
MRGGGCKELREEFRVARLGLHHENPRDFVIPQCLGPRIYILWTVLWAVYYISTQALQVYYNSDAGAEYFIYLTNWSYFLQSMVVFLDCVVTIFVQWKRKDILDGDVKTTPWYVRTLWLLFNVSNACSLVVTVSYYALLEPEFGYGSIYTHLLNSVYTILTLLFCAKPVFILHVYQPIIYSVIYVLFSIIYHVTGNDPVYPVLDWSKPGSTSITALLIVLVGVPVMHMVIFSLYTLRLFVCTKINCFSKVTAAEKDEEAIRREVTSREVNLEIAATNQ